jgi:hypothetical protein
MHFNDVPLHMKSSFTKIDKPYPTIGHHLDFVSEKSENFYGGVGCLISH